MQVTQEPKYEARGGRIYNRASGEAIPNDEPVFIFRARDCKALHALRAYAGHITDTNHAAAVCGRIQDFKDFSDTHPDLMKEPDTALPNEEPCGGPSRDTAIVGIDPKTMRCEVVAIDEPDNWAECRDMGLIVVPTTIEHARSSWGQVVADVYALAAQRNQ